MTMASERDDIAGDMAGLAAAARRAARALAGATTEAKNAALAAMAANIRQAAAGIAEANARDVALATTQGRSAAHIDRLSLGPERIEAMATGLEAIAALPDPVGAVMARWTRPNGLEISRVRVPIGVIAIIYESRPNVTADAGALCMKSGNTAILRGGSDSFQSSALIVDCMRHGLKQAGLDEDAIQMVPTSDRRAVGLLLEGLGGGIDLIVPRGGKSLVARVQAEARVPVFAHLEGICHVYVDGDADLAMARDIVVNSKMRRTGVCGAAETLLVDRAGTDRALKPLVAALIAAGCEVRGDAEVCAAEPRVKPASEDDWAREYLDAVIAVRVVDGVAGAIDHIARYGSQHTDSIVTANAATARRFLDEVDSAIVLHNASTQFADGGEFGFGAEIGIATGKLHARGPVGLEQLTTFKYQVRGCGQVRA
jgi:glutamate-5-semialdehyde dehydrogenase